MERDPIDGLSNLLESVRKKLRAQIRQSEAIRHDITEQEVSRFVPTGSVHLTFRTPHGNIRTQVVFLSRWQNGDGATVYTLTDGPTQEWLAEQSQTIATQERAFLKLSAAEQQQAQSDKDPRFVTYFGNKYLGDRYYLEASKQRR